MDPRQTRRPRDLCATRHRLTSGRLNGDARNPASDRSRESDRPDPSTTTTGIDPGRPPDASRKRPRFDSEVQTNLESRSPEPSRPTTPRHIRRPRMPRSNAIADRWGRTPPPRCDCRPSATREYPQCVREFRRRGRRWPEESKGQCNWRSSDRSSGTGSARSSVACSNQRRRRTLRRPFDSKVEPPPLESPHRAQRPGTDECSRLASHLDAR